MMIECPCGSGKPYKTCCGIYLGGGTGPETAVDLMRSRYTAHARRDAAYLLRTWHPETRPDPAGFYLPEDIIWVRLDVMDAEAGGPGDEQGTVEFTARFTRQGRAGCLHEKSRFVRLDGQWLYVGGDVKKDRYAAPVKAGRNDPCPCGSGRKYKKCCL